MNKNAIVLSTITPTTGVPVSLATLCGTAIGNGNLFKGTLAFPAANNGTNYLKSTVPGGGDVPIVAGSFITFSAVDPSTVRILMSNNTDKINIVGEGVMIDLARPGSY